MVVEALKIGYRHIDEASGYQNEEEVGRAIRDSGVPRKDIFVTTKLNNTDHHRVREAFDKSLAALDIEYIDLWLLHWPQAVVGGKTLHPTESPTINETWAEMVKVLDTSKVRAIGVANFGVSLLKSLLESSTVIPTVNQIELHPLLPQENIRKFAAEHGIIVTAYSPLGQPWPGEVSPLLTDESVQRVARKLGITEGQVVLSWGVQHGIVVIPKSENPERLKANISLVNLDDDDLKAIDEIHKKPDQHRSLVKYHIPPGSVYEWTYEQLGWDMITGSEGRGKA
ncbi:hypothetical protein SLS53_001716 [Cytospora paraplurivora]|uniref:NADP-dependent oxidoreductase domain-containing protein n=1 Tax=Cytospora paraplurivora TaxID=2898453 RepID=A0AAN9UGL5_9PEZI